MENRNSSKTKKKRRMDYISNQMRIMETFTNLLQKRGRKPTQAEISEECGVDRSTVIRHMRRYKSENYINEFRILTDKILIALYEKAKEGRAPEVKLWMQLVENWKETQGLKHSGKIKFEKINFVLEPSVRKNNETKGSAENSA